MAQSILIAAEGLTDYDTLTLIIEAEAKKIGVECTFKLIFPIIDATLDAEDVAPPPEGGWSRVMTWVKNLNGSAPEALPTTERDKATWASAGMVAPPPPSSPASWELFLAIDDSILILHLDGDVAEHIGIHHPYGHYIPGTCLVDYCSTALYSWSGLTFDRAVCAIPVQCIESWYLALYSLEECKIHCAKIDNYESLPTADVYNLLCLLGHKKYENTVDKVVLPKKFGKKLLDKLDALYSKCPSALRFTSDIKEALVRRQTN